jgi:hypothetical protein
MHQVQGKGIGNMQLEYEFVHVFMFFLCIASLQPRDYQNIAN